MLYIYLNLNSPPKWFCIDSIQINLKNSMLSLLQMDYLGIAHLWVWHPTVESIALVYVASSLNPGSHRDMIFSFPPKNQARSAFNVKERHHNTHLAKLTALKNFLSGISPFFATCIPFITMEGICSSRSLQKERFALFKGEKKIWCLRKKKKTKLSFKK